jgi:hypothetical protein
MIAQARGLHVIGADSVQEPLMRTPDGNYVSTVLAATEAPCVSIYLPTTRGNGNDGARRFRALADRAATALTGHHPTAASGIITQLHNLHGDDEFWSTVMDGVVVLASPVRFDAFTLPRTVPERAEVGDSFHVKPLLRYAQSAEPFHVLAIARERVALFSGNRYVLTPLKVGGVPLAPTDALGTEADERVRGGQSSGPAFIKHGQEARKDELLTDTRRFFRVVDHEVLRRVSEPSGRPLILAGVEDNLSEFRAVTKNRFVSADSIHGDWTHWSLNEIREKAWKVFEKHYLDRLARIREDFGTATARKKGSDDLADAARAAANGRIGVLLIDADRSVGGSIDMTTGALHPASDEAAGDMLDDLAEMGLKEGAMVIVTPSDQMPTQTGLAAIYRY